MSHISVDIKNVTFAYEKSKPVLSDISFHVGENESVGIIGANGAGKSSLLKLIVGLYTDYEGCIRVEDIPVEHRTLALIREKVGYVFQNSDSQLFMSNVYDDVAFAPRNYGLSEEETDKRVKSALERVGALDLIDRHIYKLSGGEKKLVSIATILSMIPNIILMDEPSAALDPRNRRNLIKLLNSFSHLKIIASHDLDLIMDTCKRTILISEGVVVADDDTRTILTDEKLLEKHGLELPLSLYNNR